MNAELSRTHFAMRHGFFFGPVSGTPTAPNLSDFEGSIYPIFDDFRGGREFTIDCNILRDKALQLAEKWRPKSLPLRFFLADLS
jgi:hypothetical protein